MKGPKGLKVGSQVRSVYLPKGTTGIVEMMNHAWAWVRWGDGDKIMRIERVTLKVVIQEATNG